MRDEESGNTATTQLLGPPRHETDTQRQGDALDLADLGSQDDAELVPAVKNYSVRPAPPSQGPPLAVPPAGRPPVSATSDERTVEVPRPRRVRHAISVRDPAARTSWGRGVLWVAASAALGGVVTFVAVRARTPATDDPSAVQPRVNPPPPEVDHAARQTAAAPVAAAPEGPAAVSSASTSPMTATSQTTGVAADEAPSLSAPIESPTAVATSPRSGAADSLQAAPRIELLATAEKARQEGRVARAEAIYRSILARDADDYDALTGLADLAFGEGRSSDARAFYEHALVVLPSHKPALLGLADTLWQLDDREAARARYRELLELGPPSSYPPRVGRRAAL